jgi:hypothetical protein
MIIVEWDRETSLEKYVRYGLVSEAALPESWRRCRGRA